MIKNKNCSVCVYDSICDRKDDLAISDCCIPERPLRLAQAQALDWNAFMYVSKEYIRHCKERSEYWVRFLGGINESRRTACSNIRRTV
jgi:hypothetical protein